MNLTRRDFVKAIAAAAVVPSLSEGSTASIWTVNRGNMWAFDGDDTKTLARCDRTLAANPDDVLALCHRGQVSCFVRSKTLAEVDLNRAVSLEASPAMHYIRGVILESATDLDQAITLLTAGGDIDGKAVCTNQPDIYKWHGTDQGELLYMAQRELGGVLEEAGCIDEALVAFERAASFRVIFLADLERWTESSTQVGRWCEAVIGYRRLIEIQPRPDYFKRREECESWIKVEA